MKALTICQPYAELIARGEKLIENRAWFTPYRGPLIIHAGKSRDWLDLDNDGVDVEYGLDVKELTFGAIVATARLVGCVTIEQLTRENMFQKHANGPWCWILRDVKRVKPVPYRGAQGLFDIPDAVIS